METYAILINSKWCKLLAKGQNFLAAYHEKIKSIIKQFITSKNLLDLSLQVGLHQGVFNTLNCNILKRFLMNISFFSFSVFPSSLSFCLQRNALALKLQINTLNSSFWLYSKELTTFKLVNNQNQLFL